MQCFLSSLSYLERDKPKDGHKKHYCYFCQQLVIKLPRHLERNHKYEDDVKEALKCNKKSLERKQIWTKIARKGDYQATVKSLKEGKDFIYMVRENGQGNSSGALPCEFCLGFFSESRILTHEKKCFMKNDSIKPSTIGSRMMKMSEIASGEYTQLFTEVLSRMKQDEIFEIIKKDNFLLMLGSVEMLTKETDRYADVRYVLRTLAKVLRKFRVLCNSENIFVDQLVVPANYDNVLSVMYDLTGYEGPRKMLKAHLVIKIGTALKHLALMMRIYFIKDGNAEMIEKCRLFIELYETDYIRYSNHARAFQEKQKANVPEELPIEADVKLVKEYTVQQIKSIIRRSEKEPLESTQLKELLKLTFVRVLTFNARRGGEPSKLTLKDWEATENDVWKRKADIENLKDPIEKILAT